MSAHARRGHCRKFELLPRWPENRRSVSHSAKQTRAREARLDPSGEGQAMIDDSIARFALGDGDLPPEVLDMAATLLVDTLGVAAGAATLPVGRIVRDHAVAHMGCGVPGQGAHLLFDGRVASIPGAAFAMASQIDNLDAHDGWNPSKGHISCALVPVLLAFAEARPDLAAPEALAAYVRAYEIAGRAAVALHGSVSDYHTSGAWNALGAAALGCRLMRSDAATLRHALGIAEYHGPRSQMMREIATPTMLHDGSGMGAMVGASAALLARDGFTGAPAITVEAPDAAPVWADLGRRWAVTESYIKPYPICRWAHAALDALDTLIITHDIAPAEVAGIEVATFTESARLFAGMPETTSQAQYSLGFALATMLKHRAVGPEHIQGAALQDPGIAAILPRITVREDPRHSARFPAGRWSDVTVTLRDGRALHSGDVNAKGGPDQPMPLAEVEAKFHRMAATLAPARRAALWDMRTRLRDPATRFADLLALIDPPPDA